MVNRLLNRFAMPFLAASATLLVVGCTDPLEPTEHAEAGGVVIFEEGTRNVLAVSVGGGGEFSNTITVPLAGALEVEVLFLDRDDPTNFDKAFLPDEDEEQSLRITIANQSIVSFDFHGDHADFEGLAAGATTATFDFMHGNHSDFATGNLTINVQ